MDPVRSAARQALILRALAILLDEMLARTTPPARHRTAMEWYPGETVSTVDPDRLRIEVLRDDLGRAIDEVDAELAQARALPDELAFEAAV